MINTRLNWFLEKTSGYSDTQCGFRKQRSTEDLLIKIEHEIRAFDTISHDQLLIKLTRAGVKGNMLSWLETFLKQRTYQVQMEDCTSQKRNMKRGIPQGSCLSPTLFNIMISDIPHIQGIKLSEFADDLVLLVTANTIETAFRQLSQALNRLEEWANSTNLTFNPSKTKCMYFARKMIK